MSPKRTLVYALTASMATLFVGGLISGAQSGTQPERGAKPEAAAQADDPAALASIEAVKARLKTLDYQGARYDPIHFKPAIDFAKDEACLVCHAEISTDKPRKTTPAGVPASETLAWYQTLDTYKGDQQTFHWRHLQSPYAKQVMDLSCNFCHQGSDPREQSPHDAPKDASGHPLTAWPDGAPPFNMRKTTNVAETCLRCHGKFPAENMGLSGTWDELRKDMETAEEPNGCLTCHADIRTNRHHVTYLKADAIETAAKSGSDVCYGCHGGRQWYRISFPYPRHPWPTMPDEKPDWAAGRPEQSDPRFQLPAK